MPNTSAQLKKLPDSPGVYFFKKGKDILYIGKATSLKDRVRSYFASDLLKTRSMLIADMVALATKIDFQKTDSVLEALLLEAELIKKYKPKYNTKEKDDKSFNFVVITDEDFPQILIVRKRELDDMKIRQTIKPKYEFGPFSNGASLREALKIVRKIFPYRDEKCKVVSEKNNEITTKNKACFNYQIGLCPGTCVGAVTKKEYAVTIRNINLFFQGKKGELVKKLKKEMSGYAKKMEFEKANIVKRQIFSLEHIRDVSLMKRDPEASEPERGAPWGTRGRPSFRIEAYDVAHMQGTDMTGVMVVIEDGITKKADYRMFKIRRKGINDIASLREIVERRIKHPEWPMPSLVVTDGGEPQYDVARELFPESVKVVGVVKNDKHRPERLIGDTDLAKKHQKAILLANSEAHRFTLKYHRKLRSGSMFGRS